MLPSNKYFLSFMCNVRNYENICTMYSLMHLKLTNLLFWVVRKRIIIENIKILVYKNFNWEGFCNSQKKGERKFIIMFLFELLLTIKHLTKCNTIHYISHFGHEHFSNGHILIQPNEYPVNNNKARKFDILETHFCS